MIRILCFVLWVPTETVLSSGALAFEVLPDVSLRLQSEASSLRREDLLSAELGQIQLHGTLPDLSVSRPQGEASSMIREDLLGAEVSQIQVHGHAHLVRSGSSGVLYVFVSSVLFVSVACALSFWCLAARDHPDENHTRAPTARPPPTSGPSTNQQATNRTRNPPPVCPSLILPHTEARFMVDSNTFRSNSISIMGTSGRQLLQSSIRHTDTEKILLVSSLRCEDDPRVTVHVLRQLSSQVMQIKARHGVSYGTLEEKQPGTFAVVHESEVVMTLTHDRDQESRKYAMSIKDADGTVIAVAGTNLLGSFDPEDRMWRVTVKPAVDAVLVMSCALAVIVLRDP